ncbi:MAG: hypothetical protein ACRCWI_05905 [Brevinema sp.]
MLLVLVMLMVTGSVYGVVEASYDGETLIMTERSGFSTDLKTILNPITDLSVPLYSIYWNPSNNQYYYVEDGSDLTKTNGLTYKLDPKKEEQVFVPDIKDPYLQFAGYISTNERLYIDNRNKQQYIKVLIPIKDPFEVIPKEGHFIKTAIRYCDPKENEGFGRKPKTGNLTLSYLP